MPHTTHLMLGFKGENVRKMLKHVTFFSANQIHFPSDVAYFLVLLSGVL